MPQSSNARGNKDGGSDKRQSGERFERKEEFRGKHNDRGRRSHDQKEYNERPDHALDGPPVPGH